MNPITKKEQLFKEFNMLPTELKGEVLRHTDDETRIKLLCSSKEVHNITMGTLRRAGDTARFQAHCDKLPARRGYALYKKSGGNTLVRSGLWHKVLEDIPYKTVTVACAVTVAINIVFSAMNGQTMGARQALISSAITCGYFLIAHAITVGMLYAFNGCKDPARVFNGLAVILVGMCLFNNAVNYL